MSDAGGAAVWELPPIDGPVLARRRRSADLDAVEREAWDKGYAEGHEAGLAAALQEQQSAQAEIDRRVQHLGSILEFMARPIAEVDDQVQRQLALLAGAIARQVVRREIKLQPDDIIGLIRDTVSLLPVASREVRVHLNPEDARLVRSRLAEVTSERAWSITEDPILPRGGCRVTSDNSTIDAQVEQRLGAAIAAVLGDERSAVAGVAAQ
ncbi:MAG TPA: FliH/SctL family protein [Steroidobacteraceae bacterium]|jgi:flagellar assembly protein FliH|nr:FliH/SctL family protein [Steroidobacteraceae bacterium]